MAVKMSEFNGIDPAYLEKLRDAKIEDTDQLMKIWSDKTARPGLIEKTGIPEERFLQFAGMARLSRVRGMELKYLNVLTAADIDGPKRLFSYDAESLAKHLAGVVAEKKLTDPVPAAKDLAIWFSDPKASPEAVTTK
jgi:Domain of unknown function (DUF4332)